MQSRSKNILITALLGAAWIAAIAFGSRVMLQYESTPGPVGVVAPSWPSASKIHRAAGQPTLVMLAHPRCPCTRASVGELAQIMAESQGKLSAYVLFMKPSGSDADWDQSDLCRNAAQIPGVTVVSDADGNEARRFGAETSGHTFLFGADGRLLFSGGITASRGHAGGNAGESAILAAISDASLKPARTVVFGCALSRQPAKGDPAVCLN
ncbi:MAG: hypothetical protein V7609_1407 [Verrucomicrobiota bacterium]